MYGVDANAVMNGLVGLVVALFGLTLPLAAWGWVRGWRPRLVSYLTMFASLFGAFTLLVGVLGFRGRASSEPPWHVFLDMKYQGRYRPQGTSEFFADGRAARPLVAETVPYDGPSSYADAGRHTQPEADFLREDRRYFEGVAHPEAKQADGSFAPLTWANGQPVEGYFVARIPEEAVQRAGGWAALLQEGARAYRVQCAICHGLSGRGGGGPGEAANAAYGILGAYGMPNIASYHQPRLREMPDGEIFHVITHGRNSMAAYGSQVPVQARWAIVAYLRALQYAQMTPRN